MNDQHELFHQLMFVLTQLAEPKFMKGAKEHGGYITDLTEEELEQAELEEMIDLLHYRLAKILKKQYDKDSTN